MPHPCALRSSNPAARLVDRRQPRAFPLAVSAANDTSTQSGRTIYTVGHSTRSLDAFIELLRAHGVQLLADVRRYPRSRRLPHFNDESLAIELPKAGIEYRAFTSLGGRRAAQRDSINTGWEDAGFRGYADYMQTPEFAAALDALIAVAQQRPTAIMCAEAQPWRCHRRMIADALLVRGWPVLNIMDVHRATPHELTPFAHVEGLRITYPPAEPGLFE